MIARGNGSVLRDHYHLDEPWLVEFAYWVENVVTFDFGPSLVLRDVGTTSCSAAGVTTRWSATFRHR